MPPTLRVQRTQLSPWLRNSLGSHNDTSVNDGPYLSCWSHNTVMELKMIDIAAVVVSEHNVCGVNCVASCIKVWHIQLCAEHNP
jgi:hypothetical protein